MPAGGLRQGGGAKEDCGPPSGPRLWCRVRQTLPPVRTGYVVDHSVVQRSAEKRSRLISRMGFECAALKEVGCQPAVCGFAAGRKCEGGLRTTEWSATLAPRPATLPPVRTGYVVERPNRCGPTGARHFRLLTRIFPSLPNCVSFAVFRCYLSRQSVPGTVGLFFRLFQLAVWGPNRCQALSALDANLPKSPNLRFFRLLPILAFANRYQALSA
jgi:hypothetical protein